MVSFKESVDRFNQKISSFFSFLSSKLRNFKHLTRGEQVSYCCVGSGLILIIIAMILFII